jgi:hypothetical protein
MIDGAAIGLSGTMTKPMRKRTGSNRCLLDGVHLSESFHA